MKPDTTGRTVEYDNRIELPSREPRNSKLSSSLQICGGGGGEYGEDENRYRWLRRYKERKWKWEDELRGCGEEVERKYCKCLHYRFIMQDQSYYLREHSNYLTT